MSKTIDEKVVEMRFDNKNFESNVQTTMSTLDRLKEKLNLTGASKGLESINNSAKTVNFDGIISAVDAVQLRFSALQVAGVTALSNIINKATDAGLSLVNNLSFGRMAEGYRKYDQETTNVQTLINSTGKSMEEIEGYLERLMWFSDETSYGFTDMTSALAQMTSAGGDINKIVPMIQRSCECCCICR